MLRLQLSSQSARDILKQIYVNKLNKLIVYNILHYSDINVISIKLSPSCSFKVTNLSPLGGLFPWASIAQNQQVSKLAQSL